MAPLRRNIFLAIRAGALWLMRLRLGRRKFATLMSLVVNKIDEPGEQILAVLTNIIALCKNHQARESPKKT